LTLFAKMDFSGDAAKAGLQMPPTQTLIFGNPHKGTPATQYPGLLSRAARDAPRSC